MQDKTYKFSSHRFYEMVNLVSEKAKWLKGRHYFGESEVLLMKIFVQ